MTIKIDKELLENINQLEDPVLRKRYVFLVKHPKLFELIFSEEVADKIHLIAERNNILHAVARLAIRVGWVMLGELRPKELALALERAASLPVPTAVQIAKDVFKDILSMMKTELEEVYNEKLEYIEEPKRSASPMQAPAPPPVRPVVYGNIVDLKNGKVGDEV